MKHTIKLVLTLIYITNLSAQPLNDISELPENTLIYALPKTSLVIEISYTKTEYKKGLFSEYTQEYLGHMPQINTNLTEYEVIGGNIQTFTEIDAEKFYVLGPEKGEIDYNIIENLKGKGAIITSAPEVHIPLKSDQILKKEIPGYQYIPYESMYKDQIDTVYKKEFRDSAFIDVPYYERRFILKNEKDLAKEAADMLIWLNENLLKSFGRLNPEDEYETNVSEAIYSNTMEQIKKFSSFFNGTKTKDTMTYRTVLSPGADILKYPVGYFSKQTGIEMDKKNGTEIFLEIENHGNYTVLNKSNVKKLENYTGRLYYRIPANVKTTLYMNDVILYSGITSLPQLGQTITLPSKAIIKK